MRSAIITGGGSGIGLAIARRFAREGYSVHVLDINADNAKGNFADITDHVTVHNCNVADFDDVNRTIDLIARS